MTDIDTQHVFRIHDAVTLKRSDKIYRGTVAHVYDHFGAPRVLFCRSEDSYMIPCLPEELSLTAGL